MLVGMWMGVIIAMRVWVCVTVCLLPVRMLVGVPLFMPTLIMVVFRR